MTTLSAPDRIGERQTAVIALLDDVRGILATEGVTRIALDAISERLLALASQDAALFSAFASGQRHACVALPEAEVGPFRRRTLNDLLAVLGVPSP